MVSPAFLRKIISSQCYIDRVPKTLKLRDFFKEIQFRIPKMNFKNSINYCFLFLLKVTMVCCVTYYQIGIYSNCTGKANRTRLNIDAGLVSDFNKEMIQGIKNLSSQRIKAELVYKVYDVCDNFTLLVDIVHNFILDENLQIQDEKNYSHSSIIDFFMYTPPEMTTFVRSVFTQIPVYDIDHRILEDGSVYNPVDNFVEDLVPLVEFAGWEKLTLISLGNIDFPYSLHLSV